MDRILKEVEMGKFITTAVSIEEHLKISKIAKFGREMLLNKTPANGHKARQGCN